MLNQSSTKLILLFSSMLLFVSCGKKPLEVMSESNPIMDGKAGTPPVKNGQNIKTENGYIKIKSSAQNHLFLMSQAVIESAPTPSGRAQANRLVFFRKNKNMLNMFQSTQGLVSTSSIKTMILVAQFPILSEENGYIKFDFGKGMNTLFQKGSYYISADKNSGKEEALNITQSVLKKVELRDKYLFVNQIIKFDVTEKGKKVNLPAEVKYVFSSYNPNKNFVPKVSDGMKRVGYFQNHKVITSGSGEENVYIMKFDMSKVHTYYLTNNIPEEFRPAVVDGVEYWNKVFGRKVFEVKDLPAGISVHEPHHNIIQWMKWDTAGFAYANFMSDPLTGETLQANVYMTSVFGLGGLKRAKKLVKKLLLEQKNPKKAEATAKVHLNTHNHQFDKVCDTENYQEHLKTDFISSVNRIDNLNVNDDKKEEIYLRYAMDYVREVVAHEVGHTLGLRHNFAGNLKSTITPKNYEEIRNNYLLKDEFPNGLIPASTVMDYTPGVVASLLGAFIRKSDDGLSYDKQAIEFGYTKKKADEIKFDVFCSDEVARMFKTHVDCRLFDQFPNVITSKHYTFKEQYKLIAHKVIEKFEFLKKSATSIEGQINTPKKIAALSFSPEKDVLTFMKDGMIPFLETFNSKARYLGVEYKYPKQLNVFDKEQIEKETQKYIEKSLGSIGGLTSSLFNEFKAMQTKQGNIILQATINLQKATFELFLKNYQKEFSSLPEDLKKQILKKIFTYLDRFEKEVLFYSMAIIAKQDFYKKEMNFSKDMTEILVPVILSKTNITAMTSPNGYELKLPRFEFQKNKEKDLRKLAIALLMKDFFPKSGSYIRRMTSVRKMVLGEFLKEQSSILKSVNKQDINDDLFDLIYYETMNYAPMAPLLPKKKAKQNSVEEKFLSIISSS